MSAPDRSTVRAAYATAATYRQSPSPAREEAFNEWLDTELRKAWEAGYKTCKNRQPGQPEPEYPQRRETR